MRTVIYSDDLNCVGRGSISGGSDGNSDGDGAKNNANAEGDDDGIAMVAMPAMRIIKK